jgi:hypothetical protein
MVIQECVFNAKVKKRGLPRYVFKKIMLVKLAIFTIETMGK